MEDDERNRPFLSYDAPPSDDDFSTGDRLSSDVTRDDHNWFTREQERDQLLSIPRRGGVLGRMTGRRVQDFEDNSVDTQAQTKALLDEGSRGEKRTRRRHGRDEVMHKIEEGGSRSSTPASESSEGSSEADREKIGAVLARRKTSKKRRLFEYTILHILIAVVFVAIAYGAYQASVKTKKGLNKESMMSNGTSLFAPTTIFISLDGFRADYLKRGLSPTLSSFIQQGVSPKFMTPSFPSLTFPNHYTLVTGLYPESHGIVANTFWDNKFGEGFVYTNKEHSMQPKWWDQNPLWETAELQGVPTAIHMWPGSEAHIGEKEPTYVDKFNSTEALPRKVDRILSFLDKPGPEDQGAGFRDPRAQLIAAYVPNVDSNGHKFGPNSTEVNETISRVDDMLDSLFTGLEERNLTNIVNMVVVSDHGMATTDNTRLIQFEDIVDPDLIENIDGWPHYGLRPKNMDDVPAIHARLIKEASHRDGFDVYLRDKDMPERYHFTQNDRIAPLWVMAHTGWAIVTKDEYDVTTGQENSEVYHPRGIHGYDNEDPLMRAIFVARGPAFPHEPGSRLEPFQNIEVYNVICDSLKIEPHGNNGTLRLPLKPVGVHGDAGDEDPDHIAHPSTEANDTKTKADLIETASDSSIAASAPLSAPSRPAIEHEDGSSGSQRPNGQGKSAKEMLQQY